MAANRALDVRIVGGGFAGVVTALAVLERVPGARVTVYEREAAAHTTLCGEGLSADTLRALAKASGFDAAPYVAETFEEVSWFFPAKEGRKEFRIRQRGHTMARERWIPAMAEAVVARGGVYRTGVKVSEEMAREMARDADVLVGADGPGSVVRKIVGGEHETMLGIQYRVARDPAGGRVPDRLEFYTDKAFSPEYSWVFPRGEILNVGLLAGGDGHDWERLDRFMKEVGVGGKVLKREAYPIGFFGTKAQQGNAVLVGDAAGLTNPITKGGMSAVVYAAEILARCLGDRRVEDYAPRIAAHPMSDRSFPRALAAMRRWTNAEYARLLRLAPDVVEVIPGKSTERRHALRLAASLAMAPRELGDLCAVIRALGVSRAYSW